MHQVYIKSRSKPSTLFVVEVDGNLPRIMAATVARDVISADQSGILGDVALVDIEYWLDDAEPSLPSNDTPIGSLCQKGHIEEEF